MADRILVVDDEQIIRESLSFVLTKEGYTVAEASNGKEACEKVRAESFDLIITDLVMPEMKGIELLEQVTQIDPQAIVIIITAYGSLDSAITALRQGASDYILKPVEFDELIVKVRRLLDYRKLAVENQYLRREASRGFDLQSMVGESPSMRAVGETIKTVSPTDSTILITGRSGTGKELVARALHANSDRATKPLIIVNCGAIPETLFESELFGHKKGSFTGAISDRSGYFKAADGGTLFLDEVSEIPVQLQVKLLRAIEQKEVTPVGAASPVRVDVRILASSNRDLAREVDENRFRRDLYYRLNVVEIRLPSLSERRSDIPLLVDHFVRKYAREMRKDIKGCHHEVILQLSDHEWKGEIRELENVLERAVIFCQSDFISMDDLPDLFKRLPGPSDDVLGLQRAVNDFEKKYILETLRKHAFDKEKVAEELQISVPTLYRRIKSLDIPSS